MNTRLSILLAIQSAATACLLLGSCAPTSEQPPPPGSAIIDAKPDPEHRGRIEGIELVSINGRSVKGTRSVIQPGPNTVKTRFRWPQGLVQEVDLRFYATPGTVYFINYDAYSPEYERDNRVAQKIGRELFDDSGSAEGAIVSAIFLAPPLAVIGIAEGIGHGVFKNPQPATRIDLMVVAHHSSEGTVRQVRAYPDGRVDGKPWAAWAQMKAP